MKPKQVTIFAMLMALPLAAVVAFAPMPYKVAAVILAGFLTNTAWIYAMDVTTWRKASMNAR